MSQEVPPLREIARFADPFAAQAARLALEGEGIPCALFDEAQAAYPGMGMIPVRLAVQEDLAEEAKAMLRERGWD